MHNRIPSKYYFINKFDTNLINKQNKHIAIIYRNYSKQTDIKTILELKKICKTKKIKFFLSNNIKLSIKLKLDGAYIPSFNSEIKHLSFSLTKDFILIGSAHNYKEIKIKEKQRVSAIFLSSIFKQNANYLGLNKFKLLSNLSEKKIIALGGVSKENLKKIKLTNSFGIAGISFFEQKKGP